MNFLIKLESAINSFLIRLFSRLVSFIPKPMKLTFKKIEHHYLFILKSFKDLPQKMKLGAVEAIYFLKNFKEIYQVAKNNLSQEKSPSIKFKASILKQMISGQIKNQPTHVLISAFLIFVSFIAISGAVSKIIYYETEIFRKPASLEDDSYDRPDYYKQNDRFFELISLRLPIYVPEVNQLHSVDIDFTATMSNRTSKMFLEKNEFNFRDHLILETEPTVATFPLEIEGKEILRQKIQSEINSYLKINKVDGKALEVNIIYTLAN